MHVSKAPEAVSTPVSAPMSLVQRKLCAFYIDLRHFNRPNRIHLVIDQWYLKICVCFSFLMVYQVMSSNRYYLRFTETHYLAGLVLRNLYQCKLDLVALPSSSDVN